MLNAIPIVGWLLSMIVAAFMAVPVWFCWTWCGLGSKYGAELPCYWQAIPYVDLVLLFVIASTLKAVCLPVVQQGKS